MTRSGDKRKLMATNFLTKNAQIVGDFLGHSEKHHFLVKKTIFVTFGHLLEQIGLLFISKSGHTETANAFNLASKIHKQIFKIGAICDY